YLMNPDPSDAQALVKEVQSAASRTGKTILMTPARSETEIDAAFAQLARGDAQALIVASESLFVTQRERIIALAARNSLPACYPFREFAAGGGLMSYGSDRNERTRQIAIYTARILKGARPADLPVFQLTKMELVVNLT